MKYNILFIFSFLSICTFAQESVIPDERLYEVYEKEYIDGLVEDNPFLIERWNFYLNNAYKITKEVEGKNATYPEVSISNLENINILLLEKEQGVVRDWDKPLIYKIKDSEKLLICKSGKVLSKSLKKHLEEK